MGKYEEEKKKPNARARPVRRPSRTRRRVVAFVRVMIIITNVTSHNSKKHIWTGSEFFKTVFSNKAVPTARRVVTRRRLDRNDEYDDGDGNWNDDDDPGDDDGG